MGIFDFLNDRLVRGRKIEEMFYAAALDEFQQGRMRRGLWSKALTECGGKEKKATALYLKFVAVALRDDYYLALRSREDAARESSRLASDVQRKQELDRQAIAKIEKDTTKKNHKFFDAKWLGVGAVLLFIWFNSGFNRPNLPAKSSSQQVVPQNSSYDSLLSQFEAQYPSINPDSAQFNPTVVDQVAAIVKVHRSSGKSPEDSLRLAISEVFRSQKARTRRGASSSAKATTPTVGQPKRSKTCQYKSVMSDEDYRACGVRPPGQ